MPEPSKSQRNSAWLLHFEANKKFELPVFLYLPSSTSSHFHDIRASLSYFSLKVPISTRGKEEISLPRIIPPKGAVLPSFQTSEVSVHLTQKDRPLYKLTSGGRIRSELELAFGVFSLKPSLGLSSRFFCGSSCGPLKGAGKEAGPNIYAPL